MHEWMDGWKDEYWLHGLYSKFVYTCLPVVLYIMCAEYIRLLKAKKVTKFIDTNGPIYPGIISWIIKHEWIEAWKKNVKDNIQDFYNHFQCETHNGIRI